MKKIWKYLLILVVLVALWNQILISPFKVLSTIFHKIGHSLTAVIFGSATAAFSTTFGSSLDAIPGTKSWIASFLTANSGYISGLLFSLLILYLKRTSAKKYLVGSITIMYLLFSIVYAASLGALVTSLAFAIVAILVLMIQKDGLNDILIDIIGISSVALIIYDTFVDTILFKLNEQLTILKPWTVNPPDDIMRLSNLTGFPVLVWGLIWLAISVISINILLMKLAGKKR